MLRKRAEATMKSKQKEGSLQINKKPIISILIFVILLEMAFIINGILTKNLPDASWATENVFTVIISVICSMLASSFMALISRMNSDEIDRTVKATLKNLLGGELPERYENTDAPNKEYNDCLNNGIQSTKKYIYFSDRALYLSKRLSKKIVKHDDRLQICVFLADIREDSIFRSRKHMYSNREQKIHIRNKSQRSIDKIIIDEKMEILRSLYALGKMSENYEIHVYLHKEIPFIRFELTDSLLVLSFLTEWTSGKKYPTTFVFKENDFLNTNFTDYSEQLTMRSEKLDKDKLTVDYLRILAKDAGLPDFKDDEITKYYEKCVK